MTISTTVPWGRTLAEYRAMFSILPGEERLRIVDVGAGPASFCAEWRAGGGKAVACDPVYGLDPVEIERQLSDAAGVLRDFMEDNAHRFVWTTFASPDEVVEARMAAARRFLADFAAPDGARHYLAAGVPALPFEDGVFDLALSSHFLFLYSHLFDADFHVAGISEMMRIAREVRVFPLLDMAGAPSLHVDEVVGRLKEGGFAAQIEPVGYEFQKGGCQMLRVKRR